MPGDTMTPLQRVLTTLGHAEPDRVPFFLLLTLHGAAMLGLSIKEYFSRAEHVVEGQMRLQARYRHDCVYGFFHAPLEVEAFGGEVVFAENGPPNSAAPCLRRLGEILELQPPRIEEAAGLVRVLSALSLLRARVGDQVPVLGVAMSPFSLPVMQLGFERYLELILDEPVLFARLMQVNEEFCVSWANAQLAAGATAIAYFDPVSSPTIVPPELYRRTGHEIARRTLARIRGPVAVHLASGRCLAILDDLAGCGTPLIGVSAEEDLTELKAAGKGRLALLGNLNGIEMRRWTAEQAELAVRQAIAAGGPGGGFILADNHGEIPWQVPDEVLMALSEAVHRWGTYPLSWVATDGR